MKKHMKGKDGLYHIGDKKFELLTSSRPQVWHGRAYKTPGGLKKSDLLMNKHGRIVSLKKHTTAKKDKRLEKHGFFTQKGKFGYVKRSESHKKSKSRKKTKKARTA